MANPYFNASYYLANNLDVLAAGYTVETAESHYLQYGAKEALAGTNTARKPAPWFDIQYYLTTNPDLLANGITVETAFQHFTQYGINEGRSPANGINLTTANLSAYAIANPDLVTAFNIADPANLTEADVDALSNHYYAFGYKEGRPAEPAQTDSNPGQTFTLTTGADNFTGTAGNDTFTAAQTTGATWTVGDKLDGGAGDDTLNITQTVAITDQVGTTVKNIETANLLSGTTGNNVNTTSWEGLTALNVTGVTNQAVTAAATTDVAVTGSVATGTTTINGGKNVTVTETGAIGGTVGIGATTAAAGTVTVTSTGSAAGGTTGNAITVKGGTDINITQKGGNVVNSTNTDGAVVVTGTAATKTVTVTNDKAATAGATVVGHTNSTVGITDVNSTSLTAAGTIETVSVTNAGAVTVNSGALKTLNLGGTITSVNAGTLGALTTAANTDLAVNVNGLTTTGAVTIDNDITTLNLAGNTAASTINSLAAAGAKSINVSGDAKVAVSANTLTALTGITVTNTAGFQLAGAAINTGATFTGGAGDDAVVLGATTKAITMGAGNDKVTSAGLVGTGGSVDAGDGIDTIVMTSAQAAAADDDATFNSKFTGFEVLEVSNTLGAVTLNLTGINNVSTVVLAAGGAGATSIISNLASNGTVKLTANSTAFEVQVKDATFGAADVLNLNLSNAAILTAGIVKAAGVETLNITAADANTTTTSAAVKHTVTLDLADATTVNVSGNNGLTITNTSGTKVTTFDASGVVANSTATVIDTAANLAVTYVSGNATTTANVSITGGAGDDVLTGNAAKDTIVGGAGNDTIDGKAGVDTLTGGAGVDTFVIGAGEAGITGAEKITDFSIALGGDKLDTAATALIANVTAANVTAAVGGAVDVTATVKDGFITLGGADAGLVNTVGHIKAIFELLNEDTTTAEAGAIVMNGQTYVLVDVAASGATSDIIQLAGVTTATSLSLADAANSIYLI